MNWQSILQRQQGWTIDKANEFRLSIERLQNYTLMLHYMN